MKRLLPLLAVASPFVAFAQDPAPQAALPPPPVIIINYGSYQSGSPLPTVVTPPPGSTAPVVATPVLPAPPPTPAVGLGVTGMNTLAAYALPENEPNGFALGLLFGITSPKVGDSTMSLGVAPKFRFLRFLSLEGEGLVGTSGSLYTASAQVMAQITFHSVLFDLTPRFGGGYTSMKQGAWKYSGPHLSAGLELGFGALKVTGEIRGGSRMTQISEETDPWKEWPTYQSTYLDPDDYSWPDYGYDDVLYTPVISNSSGFPAPHYEQLRLGISLGIDNGTRLGVTHTDNRAASHWGGYLQFGF